MQWRYLDTGKRSAEENMALDAALLVDLKDEKTPLLHLYDWERDALTYGHFIDPGSFLNLEAIHKHQLDLAKRPTGGGIVFHNCDLAFSVLVPATAPIFSTNPLDNYGFINSRVIWAIEKLLHIPAELLSLEETSLKKQPPHFCMAKPTKYDVMIQGKKVGGASQRKTRQGFLHQGSIFIGFLSDSYLEEILLAGKQVIQEIRQNSFALLENGWTRKDLEAVRAELKALLQQAFSEAVEVAAFSKTSIQESMNLAS